jgi:hypothetical protein
MAYRNCRYYNQDRKFCEVDKVTLQNIPQLPWGHRSCNVTDISNCGKNWKTQSPVFALVPTMSRPLPQIRNWCAPGRPMPDITGNNMNFSKNGGQIDPETGQYINNPSYNGHSINHDDYLQYNNPPVRINDKGEIACGNESGTLNNNFYSGPGWKSSRVHGRTKNTALPRPIKHWRRQLFPRQYIDDNTKQPLPDLPNGLINVNTSKITRGRHYSGLNLFERPNGYTITTIKFLQESIIVRDSNNNKNGGRALSCQPIWIEINVKKNYESNENDRDDNSCKYVNENTPFTIHNCTQSNALIVARPGSYINRGPFQFQNNKGYLQSRAKLNHQMETFSYTPYIYNNLDNIEESNKKLTQILYEPNTFPPSTYSLYRNNQPVHTGLSVINTESCYNPDLSFNKNITPVARCLCKQAVSYKPSNRVFQRNSAVQSSSNTKRKGRNQINRKQYNITNVWGNTTANTSIYTACYGSRKTMRGTFTCPIKIEEKFPFGNPRPIFVN